LNRLGKPFTSYAAAALEEMPRQLGATPAAVLMISAHWEEPAFTILAAPSPPMHFMGGLTVSSFMFG
jgi:aromatic ring-opening dioxygenase catalytic subunit (LigB family)